MRRCFVLALSVLAFAGQAPGQSTPDYEKAPIRYSDAQPADRVARWQASLAAPAVRFAGDERAVLQAVLKALEVPATSQVLVFSKTSLQRGRIRPDRPRALYFSDDVYVGWVPGGLIELAAVDPVLGPVFYSLDPRAAGRDGARIERDADCLRCHGGTFVRDVPAVFARSVVPNPSGELLLHLGTEVVDDLTPFEQRWGGWYVTGYHGAHPHRGNVYASGEPSSFPISDARPDELSAFFEVGPYLRPTSDVVALLVLEHQMTVQNALTRAGQAARRMLAYQHSLQQAFREPVSDEPTYDSVRSVFASVTRELVDRLLFREAAPLPEGITGDPEFRAGFAAAAIRDRDGRSLRDLHLEGRLFAWRCSYLIYSEMFRELPAPLRRQVFGELRTALTTGGPDGRYAYLPEAERQQILAILTDTLPEARAAWSAVEH